MHELFSYELAGQEDEPGKPLIVRLSAWYRVLLKTNTRFSIVWQKLLRTLTHSCLLLVLAPLLPQPPCSLHCSRALPSAAALPGFPALLHCFVALLGPRPSLPCLLTCAGCAAAFSAFNFTALPCCFACSAVLLYEPWQTDSGTVMM